VKGEKSQLHWIFNRPDGRISRWKLERARVRLVERYFELARAQQSAPVAERPARHPEGLWEELGVNSRANLRAITGSARVTVYAFEWR